MKALRKKEKDKVSITSILRFYPYQSVKYLGLLPHGKENVEGMSSWGSSSAPLLLNYVCDYCMIHIHRPTLLHTIIGDFDC